MKGHLSGDQIDRYLARTLAPGEVLALHEHTEGCPDCRKALGEAALARMPCAMAPLLSEDAEPHLSEEEMVAFVTRRMLEPRRAQASRHVAGCDLCLDSVQAMESVQNRPAPSRMDRSGVAWFAVAGAAAATLLVAAMVLHSPRHPAGTPQPALLASVRDAGGTIELDSQGRLMGLSAASPEEQNLVREALLRGSLPTGQALPAEAPGVLLGPGSAAPPFAPLSPLNTRVLSDRPVFTWQVYPGGAHYQVLVTNENLDPMARSGMLTGTEWQPEKGLPRGVILLWQVRAWHGSEMVSAPAPPAPPARFEIAAEPVAERIEQLRTSPRPSHLLAAVLCARAGLRDEAAKELQALAQENPDSKVVGSLEGTAAGQ
ncbi:MAG TPA: zf-HC2 domain-containing protein [Bryobacteraceae bacterium]|nr:zf-HC2 domain-containing protein [Bryobacteraceae bacterium]